MCSLLAPRLRPPPGDACPEYTELLRASEGDGTPGRLAQVTLHLEACPDCSDRMWRAHDLLQRAADVMRAGDPPPRAARAAEAARRRHASRQSRLHDPRAAWFRRAISLAAAAALLLGVLCFSTTHTVVLRADELLARAERQEAARPGGTGRRVRMRWLSNAFVGGHDHPPAEYGEASATFELIDGVATDDAPARGANAPTARLLAEYHFDPRRPLCIRDVREWRARLPRRQDRVVPIDERHWALRTTTSIGLLRLVEIVLRRDTLEMVRQTLVFDGIGRLEFEAQTESAPRARPQPDAPPALLTAEAIGPEDLEATELDVRLLLRESRLDLEFPVRVLRQREEVDVVLPETADGRAMERRLHALSPHVRVIRLNASTPAAEAQAETERATETERETEVAAVAASATLPDASQSNGPLSVPRLASDLAAPPSSTSGAAAGGRPLAGRSQLASATSVSAAPARWIERWQQHVFADSPDERAGFSRSLTRLARTAARQLALINGLARRYPDAAIVRMPPGLRVRFQRLLALHHRALNADLHELNTRLAVLGPIALVTATATCDPQAADAAWRLRALRGLEDALHLRRDIDRLVSLEMRSDETADSARGEIERAHRAFQQLWTTLNGSPICES